MGKTTLAVHIAGILAEEGKVLLIDCDEQSDAWEFYANGEEPEDQEDFRSTEEEIDIIYNSHRSPIKNNKNFPIEEYDYVVLDMDTPLPNIVQVIIGSDPDIVLIPVNVSQKSKSLRNLNATLEVIARLEKKATFSPNVKVIPLGVPEEDILRYLKANQPNQLSNFQVSKKMDNLQEEMQEAIYEERCYIWDYQKNKENLREYFQSILDR